MITIGMPLYNEEKFLEETLTHLLANERFIEQIIISDNASTDNTQQICSAFMKRCNKIQYIRHEKQIPVQENWGTVLRYSTTKYFMWLAGHDLITANYIERLVSLLEENPDANVAVSSIYRFEDDIKASQEIVDFSKYKADSTQSEERINFVIENWQSGYVINQVWRREILVEVNRNMKAEWGTHDNLCAMAAALRGRIVNSKDCAYYYRVNWPNETNEQTKIRREAAMMQKNRDINPNQFIPVAFWHMICDKFPIKKEDLNLKNKIELYCEKYYGAYLDDNIWIFKHNIWLFKHRHFERKNEVLNCSLMKNLVANNKRIFLFGAGECGKIFYQFTKDMMIIEGFIDNQADKIYDCLGVKVNFLDYLDLHIDENAVIIICTYFYFEEILLQVQKKNFIYGKNVFYFEDFISKDKDFDNNKDVETIEPII